MTVAAAAYIEDSEARTGKGTLVLMLLVLAYYWIGLTPFPNLGIASLQDPWGGTSNLLNQVLMTGLSAWLLATAARHPMAHAILQPRLLLTLLFGWFTVTSLLASDPGTAMRRVVLAAMVVLSASAFLLLPRDERSFAKILGITLLFLLGLGYFGVIFMPRLSIHQATDFVEPLLAGDWRGQYGHKNVASAAMVITVFGGLYVFARWSRPAGVILIAFGLFFLFKTGGKAALAMVFGMLALAWAFERWPRLRMPLAVGGLGVFNLLTVGATIIPALGKFVSSLGVDATFTDRASIWQLAFDSFLKKPLTGYGFQSFWQTKSLVYGGGGDSHEWAVSAANAHNAYVEALLNGGVPGLLLVVALLVVGPVKDVAKAEATDNDPLLTRLFTRIWLYGIFSATLESTFFQNSGPVWFMLLVAVFGLRYQGSGRLVSPSSPLLEVAHA